MRFSGRDTTCSKCGFSGAVGVLWQQTAEGDVLLRTCPCCAYRWSEDCADVPPVIPPAEPLPEEVAP